MAQVVNAANMAAALDPAKSENQTAIKLENTEKRDSLIAIEKGCQKYWQENRVFESDIPSDSLSAEELQEKYPKYFATFAYPYMNGTLHAGHAFTASKAEFMTGVARMEGKNALFPLAFHCTGMPIKASADKLVDEIKMFGESFERFDPNAEEEEPAPASTAEVNVDPTKFTSKKSKAAAKTAKLKYQFQIMLAIGIPLEEIHKFANPLHWLDHFPPLCMRDLDGFGARIDWRRRFVTTDANPYYDAFIRWQINRLRQMGKIGFSKRYTIYSPKDGQPCMDHDRKEGEGIGPTEYTALKMKVKEWSPAAEGLIKDKIEADANVYFVPATLRPETMYSQVCCFVGPKITYALYRVSEKEYYVCTPRAAWNMAFQGTFFDVNNFPRKQSELPPTVEVPGSSLIGTLVNAPLSQHTGGVRILPMETVSASKGTGVVTCVPSDSPDDYATVMDLRKKPDYYGIKREWAELEILPVLNTERGDMIAKTLVEELKINSPKDAIPLAQAKERAYKEGFYGGTMIVGDFKGEAVQVAKGKVRQQLFDSGDALPFADPAGKVLSRSEDECVVAYVDQWILNYGENDPEWQKAVLDYATNDLNTYSAEANHAFKRNVDWLKHWACARSYGLGSKLPWDPQLLVESLSDSTVYMAYYTVAHLLHSDMFGRNPGSLQIKPEQMTDDAWDYVFCRTELSDKLLQLTGISKESLETLRRHFQYWYPLDVRISAKDLIGNHLTFCLYIHAALFPRKYWPKSIRVNGHLLLNGQKMSKSTGNFLTLQGATEKFGADATRVALADGGDGMEDANFDEHVANSTILRLYTLKTWIEETLSSSTLSNDPHYAFFDKLFANEMDALASEARKHYNDTNFKLALKTCFFDFISARDFYREACAASDLPMHRGAVTRFAEFQALLLSVIAPHWSEYIWREVLEKPDTIQKARFPDVSKADSGLSAAYQYVRNAASNVSSSEAAFAKKISKGKSSFFDPRKPKKITVYCAMAFPAWQDQYIELVREAFDATHISIDDKELNKKVAQHGEMKKAMPFVQQLKKRLIKDQETPDVVFDRKLPFDEFEALKNILNMLIRLTGAKKIDLFAVNKDGKEGVSMSGDKITTLPPVAQNATPGQPTFHFENIDESSA